MKILPNHIKIINTQVFKLSHQFNRENVEDAGQELLIYLMRPSVPDDKFKNDTEFTKYIYSSLKRDLTSSQGLSNKLRRQQFKETSLSEETICNK